MNFGEMRFGDGSLHVPSSEEQDRLLEREQLRRDYEVYAETYADGIKQLAESGQLPPELAREVLNSNNTVICHLVSFLVYRKRQTIKERYRQENPE